MVHTKTYCTILAAMSTIHKWDDLYNSNALMHRMYRTFCVKHDKLTTTLLSLYTVKHPPLSVTGCNANTA